jgi:ketosteroid isomerase-like protein
MATSRANEEAEIRRRIDNHVQVLCRMDHEAVTAIYAPEIVSFDLEPPLMYAGLEAKRNRWMEVFAQFQPPLGYEIRDFTLTVADDLAFGHSLNRLTGRLKSGQKTAVWVRWTVCFRKIDGSWLIAHEQVSVPIDFASGRALLDLEP